MFRPTFAAIAKWQYKLGALLGTALSILGTTQKIAEAIPGVPEQYKVKVNVAAAVVGAVVAGLSKPLLVPAAPTE